VAAAKQFRIVVITAPERLEQEWITRLANESDVERVDRIGVLSAGIELVQQSRPEVVIVDRDLEQAEASVRQIFTSVPGILCITLVAQTDMAVLRRLVAAGARDVLSKPVQYNELINSIRSVLATEADRRVRSLVSFGGDANSRGRGKLVVVTSPKGGVGTTTIATNLAVALRQMSGGRIVLADFGLQFGDIGVHLNLWSKHTMQDLLGRVEDIDDAMLSQVLQPHTSGIQVMLAPNEPEVAGDVTGAQLEIFLEQLLDRNTYVVADTWSFLDEVAETLLRRADEILVVTTPEVPALKNAKHFLEFLRQQDLVRGRITLVLNRFPSVDGISLQDVQQHLRHPVGANIPSEGQLVTHSVNRGIPIVISHPQSWAAQSLFKLAAHVAGDKVGTITLTPDNLKGGKGKDKDKEQVGRTDKERRGLLRFARNQT
jgi:pilus assembly protein CpaE